MTIHLKFKDDFTSSFEYKKVDDLIALIEKLITSEAYCFDNDDIKSEFNEFLWYWHDKEFAFNLGNIKNIHHEVKKELKEKQEQLKELENYIKDIEKGSK